jgi:hypothetical protein
MTEPTIDHIKSVDILSLCVVPITSLLNDVELSKAKAFFYSGTLTAPRCCCSFLTGMFFRVGT